MPFSARYSAESSGRPSAAAVREVRREVYARVRNDWEYPLPGTRIKLTRDGDPPSAPPALGDANRGVKDEERSDSITPRAEGTDLLRPVAAATDKTYTIESDRVAEWRDRNYGSSDPSTGVESETMDWPADTPLTFSMNVEQNHQNRRRSLRKNPTSRRTRAKRTIKAGLKMDPVGRDWQKRDVVHSYHHADAPADENEEEDKREQVRIARKVRRRRRIEEEMSWNEGLSHWVQRRNAWTCARNVRPVESSGQGLHELHSGQNDGAEKTTVPLTSVLRMHHLNKKVDDIARDETGAATNRTQPSAAAIKPNGDVRPTTTTSPTEPTLPSAPDGLQPPQEERHPSTSSASNVNQTSNSSASLARTSSHSDSQVSATSPSLSSHDTANEPPTPCPQHSQSASDGEPPRSAADNVPISLPPPSPQSPNVQPASASTPTTTLIPLANPILPTTDPTRQSLLLLSQKASASSPTTTNPTDTSETDKLNYLHTSIYSKVILQSLTPSVPINLQVLVSALVSGWKRDGEWPAGTTNGTAVANGAGGGDGGGGNAWGPSGLADCPLDIKVPGSGLSVDAPSPDTNVNANGGTSHCPVERSIDKGRRFLQRRRRGESNPTVRGNGGDGVGDKEAPASGAGVEVIDLPERVVTREEDGVL
ncbi:MAG: hypothetical protein M1831_001456 [Alyxoria varia]|nr:MAG: hypothetical protein M1831_001456 [Alyxoria varia]